MKGLYATFSSWHIDPCCFPVKCGERRCVIIHRITRKKRNVLAPRITHGLDGKRPVRSRNRICVTLIICGHVFMTHPLFILPLGIRCDAWQGYDRESGASLPKFPYWLYYPRNPSLFSRCNPHLTPSG